MSTARILVILLLIGAAGAQSLPPELAALARLGIEAREAQRYEEAAEAFETICAAAPKLAAAHLNLGLTRHEQKRYPEAAASFEQALELDPTLTGVRGLLGFDLLQSGRHAQAAAVLERAAGEESGADVDFHLGVAYSRLGRYREALERLEAARERQPNQPELLRELHLAHGRRSAELAGGLLASAPESAAALVTAAERLTLGGELAAAAALYEAVIEGEPERRGVRLPLGDLYLAREDYDAAERVYRRESELAPGSAQAWERLGDVLLLLGRSEEAAQVLARSLELDAGNRTAQGLRGKALADLGRNQEAAATLVRLLEADPSLETAARTHYQLSRIYRSMGDGRRAAEHAERFRDIKAGLLAGEAAAR